MEIAHGTGSDIYRNCSNMRKIDSSGDSASAAAIGSSHKASDQFQASTATIPGYAITCTTRAAQYNQEHPPSDMPQAQPYPSPRRNCAGFSGPYKATRTTPHVSKSVCDSCNSARSERNTTQDNSTAAQVNQEHARCNDCATPARTSATHREDCIGPRSMLDTRSTCAAARAMATRRC